MPKQESQLTMPEPEPLFPGDANKRDVSSIIQISVFDVHPSPENDQLYRPVDPHDPEIRDLARSIRRRGIKEPLVITRDNYILSGHRRYVAAQLAGLTHIPVRVEPISRAENPDEMVRLLRECNLQRVKTHDEMLREEVVSANPEEAHRALREHRSRKSDMSDFSLPRVAIRGRKQRKAISRAKWPMLQAARRVLNERKQHWPLSDRQVHYGLLNDPPLRHASKPDSRYTNTPACYHDLCDLLTRARLAGLIPWESIADETRPVIQWQVYPHAQAFIRQELDRLFLDYYRDLQHTQPNHIEIVGEKLTIRSIIQPVAARHCLPVTIGRGYCSIDPRRQIAQRFVKSGREKLIILMLSDFDPDGENIVHSFARSLRDDFGIDAVEPIKVALTADQVRDLRLPPKMKAKRGASTYKAFAEQHGDDVFELEAVPPNELERMLTEAIERVIDASAFNAECDAERKDAAFLQECRQRVHRTLSSTLVDEAEPT